MQRLPIDDVLPELIAASRRGPNAVLQAPTGAGKTTRVPPALLDAGLTGAGRIVMLEPRRLAARSAARRMAHERGQPVGAEIGYHVRFDKQAGQRTRIICVTPGILLRMLHDDPFLESVGAVIFDEFHERGLDSDLALGLARHIQSNVRPELRLIAMSATLDAESVARYLGGCPIITSAGRSFPVAIRYEPRPDREPLALGMAQAIERVIGQSVGDVLAFLPGLGEIRQTMTELEDFARSHDLLLLPLHGELPAEQQDAALFPQDRRRVVLATNVAETSVTVDGITTVVDSGLARQLLFDTSVGLDRLELLPISQASADQRAGRAGRTQPGECIRLWSEVSHSARPVQTPPEIRCVDPIGAVLHLLALGESDLEQFPWLEPPRAASVEQSMRQLTMLGAVDANGVTELGKLLARLPVQPRLGRLLVEGHRRGDADRAALAAALLSERDPFPRPQRRPNSTPSDLLDRIEAIEDWEGQGVEQSPLGAINRGGARFILRARDQLLRSLRQELPAQTRSDHPPPDLLLQSLVAAFPDRLAKRREHGSDKALMVGGRGVRLAPSSGVIEGDLFLALDIDAGQSEGWVRMASMVQRDWLPKELLRTAIEVEFDNQTERVIARKRTRFEDLVIDEVQAHLPSGDAVARVLADAGSVRLDRIRPTPESAAGSCLLRLECLRLWMPELNLPAVDDELFRELLSWACIGCKSLEDVRRADWIGLLQGKLTRAQWAALEREAPEHVEVPTGSKIALQYEAGRPPILAVRLQELFGLTDTPRIAGGRVKVLLHLLAPNYRPQQITDDLASFWANGYPIVRKELRARYPKHAWPDDPLAAEPIRGPKRRGQDGR